MLKESDPHFKTMILYLEGKLDFNEKKDFESILLKSPKQLNFLLNTKKDLSLMDNLPFEKVPDELLKRVLQENYEKQEDWGEIVLNIAEKGFELLKNSFSLNPPKKEYLAYRNTENDCEQLIFSEGELELSFLSIPKDNKINLNLLFNTKEVISENVELYRKTDKMLRMIASFQPTKNRVSFQGITPADYIIKILDRDLFLTIQLR